MSSFGKNLRAARKDAGLSQDELHRRSRIDRGAISLYENDRREPNLRTIVRIANALGIAAGVLVRGL